MSKNNINAAKYQDKIDRIESRSDFISYDRQKRRSDKIEFDKFLAKVRDKDWFLSLEDRHKKLVIDRYSTNMMFGKLQHNDFWTYIKKEFPGNISKRRDSVIDKILPNN